MKQETLKQINEQCDSWIWTKSDGKNISWGLNTCMPSLINWNVFKSVCLSLSCFLISLFANTLVREPSVSCRSSLKLFPKNGTVLLLHQIWDLLLLAYLLCTLVIWAPLLIMRTWSMVLHKMEPLFYICQFILILKTYILRSAYIIS